MYHDINTVKDEVVVIKLQEVLKTIQTVPNTQKPKDSDLIGLMQYYELLHEIENA